MNFRSGKFCTLMLRKSFALARVHALALRIGGKVNWPFYKFSELRICCVGASPIADCDLWVFGSARGQMENLSRSEFPALKIETVENGLIRQ